MNEKEEKGRGSALGDERGRSGGSEDGRMKWCPGSTTNIDVNKEESDDLINST